ncbi:phage antirepressor N-terminal domain-containing protein [Mesorhizobium sp. BR1-1-16]|uniref:phage antirepressor N-terminal domain-containing protein n=1 Tax=Mesorhizobium sp. BR1-1-16 TaxID=2876653 RepID=UPI001CCC37E6|nr:phage antirepressor N-terminal domain-containing protein [Mesorhizobium sp. BR1-1-16]MBZ9939161.1 phage antirepressor N-terminal domain-containing protein [Mesorhizobium sp. BR1-1-16]
MAASTRASLPISEAKSRPSSSPVRPAISVHGGTAELASDGQIRAHEQKKAEAVASLATETAPAPSRNQPGNETMSGSTHGGAVRVVEFRGVKIDTVDVEGQPHVALRPIVEGMGLDWSAQWRRVERDAVLSEGVAMTAMPSRGGAQQAAVIPLKMLNGFLFGIDAGRVRPEIRETVIAYQRECYDALAAYWSDGFAARGAHGTIEFDERSKAILGGILKGVVVKQTEDLRAGMELMMEEATALRRDLEVMKLAKPVAAFDLAGTVTARDIMDLAGIPKDGRVRGTTGGVITRAMKDFCLQGGYAAARTPESIDADRRWRFPREAALSWLNGPTLGSEIIRNHIQRQRAKAGRSRGQASLTLIPRSEARPA